MARALPEWIGKTPDSAIPQRVQDRVFAKFGGACPKCTRLLEPGKWECDHVIPLILGGENREINLQPLCSDPCHTNKTRLDVKLKAKVARVRKKHLGIRSSTSRPIPGSKRSGWRKRMNGAVERRSPNVP